MFNKKKGNQSMNKNVKILALILLIVIVVVLLLFFNIKNNGNDNNKEIIAVSIMPEKEFVRAVAGEDFKIISMIPSGASPENYEPTPMEKETFEESVIYFSIGVPTEENNILPNVSENTKLVKLDEVVREEYADLTFANGSRDPHIWLSPQRAMVMVQKIADELSELKPQNKEKYQENAKKYISELENSILEIDSLLAQKGNRKFIVYHPAFAYLADEFGLEMYALEEDGKEATVESLKEKIDLAKKEGIKYIFYQAEIDSSQAKAFAEEIGGQTMMLEPLAENYLENLKKMANLLAE